MKKTILAPLSSALVIPGLGQVINHDLKKGIALLGTAFVLLVIGAVKFFQLLSGALETGWADPSKQAFLIDQLKTQDLSLMKWVSGAFLLIWTYSVIDAFLRGKKLDRSRGDEK
jgi:hypothetical protein